MGLKFGWVVILTSGTTVDDREVTPEMILDMAETYDPEYYNARINFEHSRKGQKLGSVLELKSEERTIRGERRVVLLAMLEPNSYMLYVLESGQKIHSSCEIKPNFAKTGKHYLTGLALTDEPASIGTSKLELSSDEEGTEIYSTDEIIEGEKPSMFDKFFSKNKEDDLMSKATLELMSQLLEAQQKTTTAIETLSASIQPPADSGKGSDKPENDKPEQQDFSTSDEMKTFMSTLSSVTDTLKESNQAVSDLVQKLSEQSDEPQRNPASGSSADDEEDAVL